MLYFRTEERAAGWIRLTREILKLVEAPSISSKDNAQSIDALPPKPKSDKPGLKSKRPQPLFKLAMRKCRIFVSCC